MRTGSDLILVSDDLPVNAGQPPSGEEGPVAWRGAVSSFSPDVADAFSVCVVCAAP